jgi:arsenic resistance protein ArsH
LSVHDPALKNELKVKELCALTLMLWSTGHVWVSPEVHGTVTVAFKNQIDWILLNVGSLCLNRKISLVGPGQRGKAFIQRGKLFAHLGSVAKAEQEFNDNGWMKDSSFHNRVVDFAEEFAKFTAIVTPVSDELTDR